MNKKRLKKGQAKVEYLAVKNQVLELTAKGYDLTAIHKKLLEAGQITMSYKGFYENHNYDKLRKKQNSKERLPNRQIIPTEPGKSNPAHQKQAPVRQAVSQLSGTIVDLGSDLNETAAKHQAYQERQAAADEDQASLKENLDKYIGK